MAETVTTLHPVGPCAVLEEPHFHIERVVETEATEITTVAWSPTATLGTDLSTIQLRIVRGPRGLEWQVWGPSVADDEGDPARVRCLQNGLLNDQYHDWPTRRLEAIFYKYEVHAREIGWIC